MLGTNFSAQLSTGIDDAVPTLQGLSLPAMSLTMPWEAVWSRGCSSLQERGSAEASGELLSQGGRRGKGQDTSWVLEVHWSTSSGSHMVKTLSLAPLEGSYPKRVGNRIPRTGNIWWHLLYTQNTPLPVFSAPGVLGSGLWGVARVPS